MTRHVPVVAPPRPLRAVSDAGAFLLDQCRRMAGARATGATVPADLVMLELKAVLPEADAYRVFGQLHDLVSGIARHHGDDFVWFPAGSRRRSADEIRLIETAMAVLAGRAEDRIEAVGHGLPRLAATEAAMPVAAAYCAVADTLCGLATVAGGECGAGCPFSGLSSSPR